MDQNTCELEVICLPLSSLENMQMELVWRINAMMELVKEGQDLLRWIKGESNTSYRPDSPPTFDPLKTIGKYC